MARLEPKSRKLVEQLPGEDVWRYYDRERKALIEALENQPETIEGTILAFPWADSAAYYIVTKEKPLTLAHLAVGDAWHVQAALIRGLRLADVLRQKG